jgi:Tfp pilus assembly protein PilN
MEKLSINLLQAELIVKPPLWNLQRVVVLWFVSLFLCLSWWGLTDYQHQQKTAQLKAVTEENNRLKAEEEDLKSKINNNTVDPELEEKLNSLTLLMKNKKQVLKQLTDSSSTESVGFSMAMTELASMHHQDISLQKISVNDTDITFSGVARRPEAVPQWLAAFGQSVFLSGKTFSHLSLGQNKQKLTSFIVSSSINVKRDIASSSLSVDQNTASQGDQL